MKITACELRAGESASRSPHRPRSTAVLTLAVTATKLSPSA
jgi:hypothetical protein